MILSNVGASSIRSKPGGDARFSHRWKADGDLVLCEWWSGGIATEVDGKPFLVVGQADAETTLAAIKVPRKRGSGWVLESWNSAYPPMELPPGAKLEPVARVLEVVEERQALALWGQYDRAEVASAFGGKSDASWTTGLCDVEVGGARHTVLFVTLRKEDQTDVKQRYDDFFPSPREFRWSSQAKTGPDDGRG